MTSERNSRRVVVVTGASGGIGRATAAEFGRQKAAVALLARGKSGLDAAAERVRAAGGTALVIRTDTANQPLGDAEGAFLLCGFIMALADWHRGDRVEAFRWFERNRAACGPPGLLAEEYDVRQRQLRGNLPQAFVHAMLLDTAQRLTTDPPDTAG